MKSKIKGLLATTFLMAASNIASADVIYTLDNEVFKGDVNSTTETLIALNSNNYMTHMFNVDGYDLIRANINASSGSIYFSNLVYQSLQSGYVEYTNDGSIELRTTTVASNLNIFLGVEGNTISARDILGCRPSYTCQSSTVKRDTSNRTATLRVNDYGTFSRILGSGWTRSTGLPPYQGFNFSYSNQRENVSGLSTFIEQYALNNPTDVNSVGAGMLGFSMIASGVVFRRKKKV